MIGWIWRAIRLTAKVALAIVALAYFAIVRSFLFTLTFYLALYFLTGSSGFKSTLESVIAGAIPGSISFGHVQWGPAPWLVTATDIRFRGAEGEGVITAPLAIAEIDLAAELRGLWRLLFEAGPIPVHVERGRVFDPWVHVDINDKGVGIARLFYIPDPTDHTPGPLLDIHIHQAQIFCGSGRVDTPPVVIDAACIDTRGDVHITGKVHLEITLARVAAKTAVTSLRPGYFPGDSLKRLEIAARDVEFRWFVFRGLAFSFGRATGLLEDGRFWVRGGLDIDREPSLGWSVQAEADLGPLSPILPALTGGQVSGNPHLAVRGEGDLDRVELRVDAEAPAMTVGGFPLGDLGLGFGIRPPAEPGRTHAYELDRLEAEVANGRVSVTEAAYLAYPSSTLPGAPNTLHRVEARLAVDGVDPWGVVGTPGIGVLPAAIPFVQGGLGGQAQVSASFDAASQRLDVELATEGLEMTWAGTEDYPLASRYEVTGVVGYAWAPPGVDPGAWDLLGTSRLELDQLRMLSGQDEVAVDGTLDLARGTLLLTAQAQVPNIALFLKPFGVRELAGNLKLEPGAQIGGTLTSPEVRGKLKLTQGRLSIKDGKGTTRYDLGTVSAGFELTRGLLQVDRLQAATPYGSLTAGGQLRLWQGSVLDLDDRFPFRIDTLEVHRLDLAKLAPRLGVAAEVDLVAISLAGQLANLVDTLRGQAAVNLVNLSAFGEKARRVTARLGADDQRWSAKHLRVVWGNGSILDGSLSWTRQGGAIDGTLKTESLPFGAISALGKTGLEFGGELHAKLTLSGTVGQPVLMGTLGVRDFRLPPLDLGDATVTLTTSQAGRRIDLSSAAFFPGFELLESSFVAIEQGVPTHIHVDARSADFGQQDPALACGGAMTDLYAVLPALAIEGSSARACADVALDFRPLEESFFKAEITSAPGGFEVGLYDEQIVYRNASVASVHLNARGLEVDPVRVGINGAPTTQVCGELAFAGVRFAAEVSGEVPFELLRPMKEIRNLFSRFEGRLRAEPAPDRPAGMASCLPEGTPGFSLTGTFDEPRFNGRLSFLDTRVTPRGFGRFFRILEGGVVSVQPGEGRHDYRVFIDSTAPVRVELDDGVFDLWGWGELSGITPVGCEIALEGVKDLYYASSDLEVSFRPALVASLATGGFKREIELGGQIEISEGTYYKSFDTLSRAFGTVAGGGRTEVFERPLTDRVPWLKEVQLHLTVDADAIKVQAPFPLGQMDLEVALARFKVRGTLDEVQPEGEVKILEGGKFNYQVLAREFEVKESGLIFKPAEPANPALNIKAQTEIEYVDASTEDRTLDKTMLLEVVVGGTLEQPTLRCTADGRAITENECAQALLTGRPVDPFAEARGETLISLDIGSDLLGQLIGAPSGVNVQVERGGGTGAGFWIKPAKNFRIQATNVRDVDNSNRFSASFELEIGDGFILEGKANRTNSTTTSSSETFESRLRFRIPLD
jgi:hypothetical protein